MTKFILMDIEGTTTSIDFVHQTLFPYASRHLEEFIRKNAQEAHVAAELNSVRQTVREEEGRQLDQQGCIQQLLAWIDADRKHTALKTLQGYLWKEGYETGQYRGHLYDDVLPAWRKWKSSGIDLGIYSSGSVEAQKLLFGYSEAGNLQSFLSAYFDTKIGHKREVDSYHNIRKALNIPADGILFLSDVEAELDAAGAAGYRTIQLLRPGIQPGVRHEKVREFGEIVV